MDGPGSAATPRPPEEGRPRARLALALLVVVISSLWLTRRPDRPLTGDSVRYAAIARTMVETGDWAQPRVRGEMAPQKPPLGYWLAAASIAVLGPSPFAASLPSVVAGVLLLLVLFLVVERLSGPLAGVSAALLLLFTPGFVRHTATLRFESLLQLLGLCAWVAVERGRERPRWFLAFWALLGASVLTKSVVGLLPLAVLALAAVATRRAHPFERRAFWAAFPVALLVAAPWYVLMTARHGATFWSLHLGREVGERVGGGGLAEGVEALGSSLAFAGVLGPLALLGGVLAARGARTDPRLARPAVVGALWIGLVLATQLVNRMPFVRYAYYALVPLAAFSGHGIAALLGRRAPASLPLGIAVAALLVAVLARAAAPPPPEREAALQDILSAVAADPAPGPLLAVAKDPDQAETFVWFHTHRSTRFLLPEALAAERASRPADYAGRLALLDDRAWDSLDRSTFEVVREGRPFSLVRLR
jgi:4-amino-4-deoxy-L-arabinose transferase-like glycosyltransferase